MMDDMNTEHAPSTAERVARKRARRRQKAVAMPDYIREDTEMRKYWAQRYRIFSKFDSGIMMDKGIFIF